MEVAFAGRFLPVALQVGSSKWRYNRRVAAFPESAPAFAVTPAEIRNSMSSRMRRKQEMVHPPTIFTGGLAHETHSFSNALTPVAAFEAYEWADADRLIATYRGTKTSVGGVIDGADQAQLAIHPGFYAFAIPSGPIPHADYEVLAGKLIESLQTVRASHELD